MVVKFKVSSFPPPINYPCTTASHVVHYMHVQSFQLPFYSQIIIGSESANPHFQDRDALTQTISINNCCFSLVSKVFSYTVTLAHYLWWLLIRTLTWHLWLSRIIFITGTNCLDTSTFYFPFSTQTRLLFHQTRIFLSIVLLVLQAHSSSTSAPTLSVHIDSLYTHKATKFIGPDTSNFISHSARNTEVAQVTGCFR